MGKAYLGTVLYIDCTGAAHTNPFIDNCGICAPYWERIPLCEKHRWKLSIRGMRVECEKCNEEHS